MEKTYNIVSRAVAFVLLLCLGAAVLVQSPGFQSFVAGKVLDAVNKTFEGSGAQIEIGSVNVQTNGVLVIKDATLLDRNPYCDPDNEYGWEPQDTILHFGTISASFSLKNLFKNGAIYLTGATVEDAVINIVTEPSEFRRNIPNINRALNIPHPPEVAREGKDIFEIRDVDVNNARVTLRNYVKARPQKKDNAIDWNDFMCIASVKAKDLSFRKGIMRGEALDIRAVSREGLEIVHGKGKARVGHGMTLIKDLKLMDKWSDFDIPVFAMRYANALSFQDFNNSVRLDIKPSRSLISTKTLQYLIHIDPRSNALIDLRSGTIKGYMSDLTLQDVQIVERLSSFPLYADGEIIGLGDPGCFAADLKASSPSFTTASAGKFVKAFAPDTNLGLDSLAVGKRLTLNASLKGRVNNFDIDMTIGGEVGKLSAGFNLANIDNEQDITIAGHFKADAVDLGAITGNDIFGFVDAELGTRASFTEEGPSTIIDSLKVDRFGVLGYDYNNIRARGKITDEFFDGQLVSTDPNVDLSFNGIINYGFNGEMVRTTYKARINNLDLHETNLYRRWNESRASAILDVDYFATGRMDAIGEYRIDSLVLENEYKRYEIGGMRMETSEENDIFHFVMDSGIAAAELSSDIPINDAIRNLKYMTVSRELPGILNVHDDSTGRTFGNVQIGIDIKDADSILEFFLPDLQIADGTSLQLNGSRNGDLNTLVSSKYFRFKENEFSGLDITFDNLSSSLNAILTAGEIRMGGMHLKDNAVSAYVDDNNVDISLNFNDYEDDDIYGELYMSGSVKKDGNGIPEFEIRTLPSSISLKESQWDIDESVIRLDDNSLDIDNFVLYNGCQNLSINGGFSKIADDTLSINLRDIDLSIIDEFLGETTNVGGIVNGSAAIFSSQAEDTYVIGKLLCNAISFKGSNFGDLNLSSSWDKENKRIEMNLLNSIGGRKAFSANGYYEPLSGNILASIGIDSLSMSLLSIIAPAVISESDGSISGNIDASGSPDNLSVKSNALSLNNVLIRPKATNVPYLINGSISLDDGLVDIHGLDIKDTHDGTANVSGRILHRDFKNLNLDIKASASNLELLNVEETADRVYGNVYADADASISGTPDALNIWADVSSSNPGTVHIPLASTVTQKESNLLTFVSDTAGTGISLNRERPWTKKEKASDICIKGRLRLTPNLQTFVEIDKENDNVISAAGEGIVNVEMRPAKNVMNLSGDYNISRGQYHFTALGSLISKNFTIDNGSSIKFGGDIKDTQLDVSTTYTLKTSLSTLIADSTSISNRRTVNCGINIGNSIKNPSLSFSINIPDLDPTTKSNVESALNTEDKVQRQFISLLLTGSFYPAEQSGVSYNDSNILYSNISNIMSGQVNNLLKKLNIPIDLGLSYLKNDVGTNIFDVAVSTQLFDNRVQINGSVGNRLHSTSANGNIVGNIDIGIKLDKEGKLQLKLFSHSSDDYTKFLDNGQKNGLGISYQREFRNRKDSTGLKVIKIE